MLVDITGKRIGIAEKLASHNADTPLHLAFSCYVFNEKGQLLVTKRADHKKVWPGVWTNSVCGHPAPDEDMVSSIERRLDFELGMRASDFKILIPDYTYKTPPFNGVIENEFCPVYRAIANSPVIPNPDEVCDFRWMEWSDFIHECRQDADNEYSWWCKDQVEILDSLGIIR